MTRKGEFIKVCSLHHKINRKSMLEKDKANIMQNYDYLVTNREKLAKIWGYIGVDKKRKALLQDYQDRKAGIKELNETAVGGYVRRVPKAERGEM